VVTACAVVRRIACRPSGTGQAGIAGLHRDAGRARAAGADSQARFAASAAAGAAYRADHADGGGLRLDRCGVQVWRVVLKLPLATGCLLIGISEARLLGPQSASAPG